LGGWKTGRRSVSAPDAGEKPNGATPITEEPSVEEYYGASLGGSADYWVLGRSEGQAAR